MRVRLVQTHAALDPAANRALIAEATDASDPAVDLVVFPEAMARDFGPSGASMAAFAESLTGPFANALGRAAERSGVAVAAGMFEINPDDPARPFNTLALAHPPVAGTAGTLTTYRKIHLYDSFGFKESDAVTAGALTPVVTDVAGVRLGLMTCYDLRFPEMARRLIDAGAQALVIPAAWVAGPRKVEHWETLLRARAIENLCFVIAVGQCGAKYVGHSQVISPYGDVVASLANDPGVLEVDIDPTEVEAARVANPSLANRRW